MDYRKPGVARIVRDSGSRRLYRLEERRNEMVKQCAQEWLKVAPTQFPYLEQLIKNAGSDQEKLWRIAMPQALFDLLDAFDLEAAKVAAEAFLKQHGYTVTKLNSDNHNSIPAR